ncbi:MAG: TolC family protein [Deltaproteobacteria bacterium]|nr:TolC family protein [Deltaproteobacteria bacterium]
METPFIRNQMLWTSGAWTQALLILLAIPLVPAASLYAGHPASGPPVAFAAAEVVEEVRARNPGLHALDARADAAGHVAPQAGAFPDPTLTVALVNQPFSTLSSPMTGVQFDLRQRLPWFKRLDALESAARQDQRIQQALSREKKNALTARAWALLWELTYLDEQERLARQVGRTLDDFVEVASAAYAQGMGRQQDLIKPQIQRQRINELVIGIEGQRDMILSELNALRDREPGTHVIPPSLPGDPVVHPELDRESLLAYAREHNPLMGFGERSIGKRNEMLRAAEQGYVPDFTVGLQYRARWFDSSRDPAGGADFFGVTIGVGLPVFAAAKQGERIREVSARLREAEHRLRDTDNQVEDRIERLSRAIERDVEQAGLYRTRIIPDTEKALQSSLQDYRSGRIEFLSVLDNLVSLFRAEMDHARRETRVHASLRELEQWVGGPLDEALDPTSKETP